MRIWMLESLVIAVTATGGDRGMESSSRFFESRDRNFTKINPFSETQSERATAREC